MASSQSVALTRGPSGIWLAGFALCRPRHWTKNLLCLLPAFCAARLLDAHVLIRDTLLFVAFCAVSSAVYILNDLHDLDGDRLHPTKKFRPLATGQISAFEARALSLVLLLVGTAIGGSVSAPVLLVLAIYTSVNLGYSRWLKHIAILDVMLIASGFILRLIGGGLAAEVPVSAWLLLCAFFLSLFLAFSKRRAEFNLPEPHLNRAVLGQYSLLMLDRFSNISATLAIATYAVFSVVSRPDHGLVITCVPVVFGIFRYLLLLETQGEGEQPELVLWRDRPMQCAIVLWVVLYAWVLHFGLRLVLI